MQRANPQLTALAHLVHKFGERIPGGGYEVRVTAAELVGMSPHGIFQEVPDADGRSVRWQYFPNITIDAKPEDWKESAPEAESAKLLEKTDEPSHD